MKELKSVKASNLESSAPPWLIPGLLPEGGISFVAGHSKTYKSWFALEIAISLASGLQCMRNWLPIGRRSVLVVAGEDSASNIRHRIQALAHSKVATVEELELHVIAEQSLHVDTVDGLVALEAEIERVRPALLIIDPLARFLPNTPESSARKMGHVLEALTQLARRHSLTLLIVHHTSKNAKPGNAGRGLRGSSQLDSIYFGLALLYRDEVGDLYVDLKFRHAEERVGIPLKFYPTGTQVIFWAGDAAVGKGWIESDATLALRSH